VPTQPTQPKPDSWFHSAEFHADCHRRRAQQRAFYNRKAKEKTKQREQVQVLDPEDVSSQERRRTETRKRFFSRENDKKPPRGDPRQALPDGSDFEAFADMFGVKAERLTQALEMRRLGLYSKGKRRLLCGRIGRRLDCMASEHHRFFSPYMCRCRYCETCGPNWFREKFSDMVAALDPVVERLQHRQQTRRRREIVVAKLDFTVPKTNAMPTPAFVRKFHKDVHRFWRAAERRFGISPNLTVEQIKKRREIRQALRDLATPPEIKAKLRIELRHLIQEAQCYGWAGCDEFGGGNTNLHRHCVYVGPKLPQSKARKELSALWSEIRGERSFVSIKRARSF